MKIREFLIKNELEYAQKRLETLKAISAPSIMITLQQKTVDSLSANEFTCGGDYLLLDRDFIHFEAKKGNGGKQYIEFDNAICYFPDAKYGRFIATKKGGK